MSKNTRIVISMSVPPILVWASKGLCIKEIKDFPEKNFPTPQSQPRGTTPFSSSDSQLPTNKSTDCLYWWKWFCSWYATSARLFTSWQDVGQQNWGAKGPTNAIGLLSGFTHRDWWVTWTTIRYSRNHMPCGSSSFTTLLASIEPDWTGLKLKRFVSKNIVLFLNFLLIMEFRHFMLG